ncbi:MAG TPA: hypothetical protein VFF12_17080, partial [Myxococcaceae bacterium]|nr:hypothetical protein [Myxococcaceae bacterium]
RSSRVLSELDVRGDTHTAERSTSCSQHATDRDLDQIPRCHRPGLVEFSDPGRLLTDDLTSVMILDVRRKQFGASLRLPVDQHDDSALLEGAGRIRDATGATRATHHLSQLTVADKQVRGDECALNWPIVIPAKVQDELKGDVPG